MLLRSFIISLCLHVFESINTVSIQNNEMHPAVSTKKATKPESPTESFNISGATKKIIGGHQCSVEKYPFMISLRRLSTLSHFCSGTLIRPDWILTAAHCVAPHFTEPGLFTAIAGISQFNQLGVQRIKINQIFVHPEFDENNYDNDIALISLEHSFVITESVKPISIPNQVIHGDLYSMCPEGITIGWGWHSENNAHLENGSIPHVPVMQCVKNLPVLSDQQCQISRAGIHLHPNTFCTMAQTTENICQGDSGGPLFCHNVQFGIVSSGYTCNLPGDTPGYYMRIDRVLNFIKDCISGQVSYDKNVERRELDVEDNSLDVKHNIFTCLLTISLYFTF